MNTILALAISLVVAGCTTFSDDGGFRAVEVTAKDRLGKDVKWIRSAGEAGSLRATLTKLLAAPLSADDAVQIALLNNRGLQAIYAELAIAEADLVQVGRIRNFHSSLSQVSRGNDGPDIEEAVRSRWAACSRYSKCARGLRGTITATRAGTGIRPARTPMNGRGRRLKPNAHQIVRHRSRPRFPYENQPDTLVTEKWRRSWVSGFHGIS